MIYRLILWLRHLSYNKGWKKTFKADVPTICVGNITVGGTGKTPMTELILTKLLQSDRWAYSNIAVLSRGYKRKSKGFQIVSRDATARFAGDEPLQIARKFPSVTVAVDKDRVHGCQLLAGRDAPSGAFARTEPPQKLEIFGDPGRSRSDAEEGASIPANIIVLDDAFQYRRLDASLKIVLVDYYHPVHKDMLLPWGRLRDLTSRIKAADVVIVTKSPAYLEDGERERWAQEMKLTPEQKLFFCTIGYDAPEPVFPEADSRYTYSHKLTLISGIANDAPLRSHLSDTYRIGRRLEFPDHHRYTKGDIRTIRKAVKESPTSCLMTTEKDAQRLRDVKNVPPEIRERMFYIPIKSVFLTQEDDAAFTKLITEIV
ncbi:MAG: tetraacyldisaccharide 4'-kinase [Bacteroidales bacterium]|nr:tetraacyldisaccharide 4'-kinase [Bacteroidales bacterium]